MFKRNLFLTAAAIAALASVSACSKGKDATATLNPGQSAPVNGVQDAASKAVGAVSASTVGANSTTAFIDSAATSDMFEVQAGKLAMAQSKNPRIKAFAAEMVKAHMGTTDKLKAMLPTAAPTAAPPIEMDMRRKGLFDNLKSMSFEEQVDKVKATVAVTLIFVGGMDKPVDRRRRERDPGQQ